MKLFRATLMLLVCSVAVGDEPKKPEPRFPLGKETTYVTGPLDDEGGRAGDDDPRGDDLHVRLPLPVLKPIK
jgi:hypothetical protein